MKKYKTALIVIAFVCSSATGFAQGSLQNAIKLKNPRTISEQANQNSFSSPSGLTDNPFLNSYINGLGNMNGEMANSNYYNAQEQQKQQIDYARQQAEYIKD